MADPKPVPVKRMVVCPECDTEFDMNEREEEDCPKCGLPVGDVIRKARVNKALRKLEDAEEQSKPNKKRESWF